MRRGRVIFFAAAVCAVAAPMWSDNQVCVVATTDGTVENGVGAEAGALREFVQDLAVPSECQTAAGKTWVVGHVLEVTRVDPSSPTVNAQVSVRTLEPVADLEPAQVLIEPRFITVDTPPFPGFGSRLTLFDGVPRAAPVMGLGPAVLLDGDLTGNQFVTVDQTPATPLRTCWTRTGSAAWEVCTNGNPAIRAVGLSLQVTPVLADLPLLGPAVRITSNLPTGTGTTTLDFSGLAPAGSLIDAVELREPGNPTPICGSPGIFPFLCSLTPTQQAKLRQSELVILVTPQVVPPEKGVQTPFEAQLISADHAVFANGFESGDTELWSTATP